MKTIYYYMKRKRARFNVNVILKNEIIWFSQKNITDLFECSLDNISLHLKNIFQENELDKNTERVALEKIPMKNITTIDDIAKYISIIISELSKFATGNIFMIDGGGSLI